MLSKRIRKYIACVAATLLVTTGVATTPLTLGQKASAGSFRQEIEFEDANHFSPDSDNGVRNYDFAGYSGNGYVYLASGWADVNFTVPESGKYKITIVSNADDHKQNYLYLDDNNAGQLDTNGGSWQSTTKEFDLSAGQHKFGVSTDWGYVALDKVIVEKVGSDNNNNNNNSQGGLSINGTSLLDKNGQSFVMRGINVAHGWYADKTYTSINAIANLGANTVRVVLCDGSQWTRTTEGEVENIINWCREKGLVCVVEVHDYTGSNDSSNIDNAVNYWKNIKDLLNANKDCVVVNIANEWIGDWSKSSMWASTYSSAVRSLRDAGLQNVLMVDAPGYGQQVQPLIDGCQQVRDADYTGNTMFSIHMYSVAGKDGDTVKNNINGVLSKGVCLVIGEFGDYQNGGDVDEDTIMSYTNDKQVGGLAWSWKGNGGTDVNLDIAYDWEGYNLSNWGNKVANYIKGSGRASM